MRTMIDTLVALMLAGILAGVTLQQRQQQNDDIAVETTRRNVHRINREVQLRAALAQVSLSEQGYPATIDPEWFEHELPRNLLVADGRSWLEVAPMEQRGLAHPLDIAPPGKTNGAFWYNPSTGIVRARVPSGMSDAATIDLYNDINGCAVDSRFPVAPAARK